VIYFLLVQRKTTSHLKHVNMHTLRKAKAFQSWLDTCKYNCTNMTKNNTVTKYLSLVMSDYSPLRNSGCHMLRSLCFCRCSSLRKNSIVLLMPCNSGTFKAKQQLSVSNLITSIYAGCSKKKDPGNFCLRSDNPLGVKINFCRFLW